ncbi:hypothetical protein [Gloeobacter kilaueensis]|uniref:General stress protein 17M-like domain-containing protein n=1 Tax=Gloeobacter kilaueensis (strain ATCC BAA-2537 / CCAP 1431/1 / ULC 316 / JS1) TaxID=1183438 RepID=U5QLB7_GLOK1|nr:hypothetical protein [Gloeobacter kilaueensis]AGY59782.1 hypothetical protein GKIL_3536 [Gloeobacter kilaueensis JS1]
MTAGEPNTDAPGIEKTAQPLAVLFRHRDAAEQALIDLRAAGFAPQVFALPPERDESWIVSNIVTGDPAALDDLDGHLRSAGLSEKRAAYFAAGVRAEKILLLIPAGARLAQAHELLIPRGGDYGPHNPWNPSREPEPDELAFSLDEDSDSAGGHDGVWARGSR